MRSGRRRARRARGDRSRPARRAVPSPRPWRARALASRLPGRPGEQHAAGDPAEVGRASVHVRPGRRLVEVEAVADREDEQAGREERPRAVRAPAGDRERPDDERDQRQVGERIREVRRDGGAVSRRSCRARPGRRPRCRARRRRGRRSRRRARGCRAACRRASAAAARSRRTRADTRRGSRCRRSRETAGSGRSATVNVQIVSPMPQAATAVPMRIQASRSRRWTTPRTMHAAPAASITLL